MMILSVRRRIADIARAEPDRTALIGFDTDLAEQVLSWREKQFTFVDQIPRSAAGKVERWRLAPYHENGANRP